MADSQKKVVSTQALSGPGEKKNEVNTAEINLSQNISEAKKTDENFKSASSKKSSEINVIIDISRYNGHIC